MTGIIVAVKIQVFIINLERRPDRMSRVSDKMNMAKLEFSRVEAVDATKENFLARENPFLPVPYAANWMSHQIAFRRFLASGASFALILEDDAHPIRQSLNPKTLMNWVSLMERNNLEFLQVGCISTFYQKFTARAMLDWVLAVRSGRALRDRKLNLRYVHKEFRAGSHAYVVSKILAETLCESNYPVALASDAFLHSLAGHSHKLVFAKLAKSAVEQKSRLGSNSKLDSDLP